MTPKECAKITTLRLGRWTRKVIDAHSTPAVLVSIGHDRRVGEVVVCVTEDMSESDIVAMLLKTVDLILKK